MRRPIKHRVRKPAIPPNTMSRELDWLVDEWRACRPEDRLQLVLAKIRAEEKIQETSQGI